MGSGTHERSPAKITRKSALVIERPFEVVTPMFGGGVHIDEARPHHKNPDPM